MKILKKIILIVIALVVASAVYAAATNVKTEDIKIIYYSSEGGYNEPNIYYTIDFDQNTITREVKNGSMSAEKWAQSRNKKIKSTAEFNEEMKKQLVKGANKYGVPRWFSVYKTNHEVNDISTEEIRVVLTNSKSKTISCEGRYPLTFFRMRKEFYKIIRDF